MRAVIALMFGAFLLAGCGQKGDLYLPTDSSAGNFAQEQSQ
ncbi:MAG: LPS translocon maturation chaperone LptM [Endozoicomonas sp.]